MRKTTFRGVICLIIVLILTAGIVLACGIGSSWFTNKDFKTWFNGWGQNKPIEGDIPGNDDNTDNTTDGSGNAVISDGESYGVTLLSAKLPRSAYEANGIDPQADTAFTLTATVEPANADNKKVTYSISWKNPSSTWAEGKNISDYLTLSQSADGGLTATLTCKKAFGEQAIVTVTSQAVATVNATITVDYRKKLLGVTGDIFDGNTSTVKVWNTTSAITVPKNYEWSDGTISDYVYEDTSMTVSVSSALKTSLNSVFTDTSDRDSFNSKPVYYDSMNWGFYNNGIFCCETDAGMGMGNCRVLGVFGCCAEMVDYGEADYNSSKYNKLRTSLLACSTDLVIELYVDVAEGDDYRVSYNVNILDSALKIMPSSIATSTDKIVF